MFGSPTRPHRAFARGVVFCTLLVSLLSVTPRSHGQVAKPAANDLFARKNLIAWCIVPFDSKKRSPEQRAAMLEKLGFQHFAYDWRAEHVATFDAEIEALKRHHVSLDAFWAPGELNRDTRNILDVLKRHQLKTQLWVLLDFGADRVTGAAQQKRVATAVEKLAPLALEAASIGCTVVLYNHGGWFGEPENQIEIVDALKKKGLTNVGIVYNQHHGHDHIDRFPALLAKMKPYLLALNINGMDPQGDRHGRKILPLGQGSLDLGLLKVIRDSGYSGPIGILGHTMDDAEARLQDNLDGLDWLLPQLEGKPAGPKPTPRTPVQPAPKPAAAATLNSYDPAVVAQLLNDAKTQGDARRGAQVFASAQFGCMSCHKIGGQGGTVGPDLSEVGKCLTPELIAEALLWPKRQVVPAYSAFSVALADGRVLQGYKLSETSTEVVLREATTGVTHKLSRSKIEELREQGTLMPDGLAASMTSSQRSDLVRFLGDLGKSKDSNPGLLITHGHTPVAFPYTLTPIDPHDFPNSNQHVNRDRVYDFYQKEAEYFSKQPIVPLLLPQYPGIDNGKFGHWGNQNEETWKDGRWNQTELGTIQSGIFRGAGVTVPKGVCVRLGKLNVCFNPETLCYEALWSGGFVRFSDVRHGFMDGLIMDGTALPRPEGAKPSQPFEYHGFYRHGNDIVFSYRVGDTEMLDVPQIKDGKFVRVVGPANNHPYAAWTKGGPANWPTPIRTASKLGKGSPYAVDTIEPPFQNPWKSLMFFGDHDFLPDGSALICTMQGDVWHVTGLDASLKNVKWRRFASGLSHPLGLKVVDGIAHVLGRDQITRLYDLNGDGEADRYECYMNTYETSPNGHDFICGLQRDQAGNFYTASGKQGILKLHNDRKTVEVIATGFRNPDGLGLSPEGVLTVPSSEGEWTMASMVSEIRPGGHYGYGGPRDGKVPDLPLVYMPRGLDNSSGGQVFVDSDRWGPLKGQMIHLSFGTGTHFLVLRDKVDGQPQGAVVPLPGDFDSGVHRGRFNPADGQLYVSGMAGWGSYTPKDGNFQRVRYTGEPVRLPVEYKAHENGVMLKFSQEIDKNTAENIKNHFAQAWNYRFGVQYGSPEFSPGHPGVAGHDPWMIRSAHLSKDGRSLFLEIPEIQPVNMLHLHLRVDSGRPVDVFATVHKLRPEFVDFVGYQHVSKTIGVHPIVRDLANAKAAVPNPFKKGLPNAKPVIIEAGKNLTYSLKSFNVKPGQNVKLTFFNPDVVPHNWVLLKPGKLAEVGEMANKIIADPDAALRHYVPKTPDVLVYTDIVSPGDQLIINFTAPKEPGRYPYLCTFPGHWMVMNGVMVVE
jgi:putative heme-binding domain-containing protein